MALPAILGIAAPLISGIAGLFSNSGSKQESTTSKTSGDFASTTSGAQSDLPPELMQMLTQLFGRVVGSGSAEVSQEAGQERLEALRQFDPVKWAEEVTQHAATSAGLQLNQGINTTTQAAGGRGSTMTTLLENRLRNETAANLGGVATSARATGEQIANQGVVSLIDSLMKSVTDTVAVTRGAQTAGTLTEKGTQKGTSTGTGSTTASSGGGLGGFFTGLASGLDTYWKAQ